MDENNSGKAGMDQYDSGDTEVDHSEDTEVDEYDSGETGEDSVAKIYYADEEATQVDAAFVIEDWDWVVGFNQIATDESDYVSIPVEMIIGVMSPKYTTFTRNGRRVTGYGVDEEEAEAFADQLPV